MPSKIMEALRDAGNWLAIQGVDGVSANEQNDTIIVFVSGEINKISNVLPGKINGFKVSIKKVSES